MLEIGIFRNSKIVSSFESHVACSRVKDPMHRMGCSAVKIFLNVKWKIIPTGIIWRFSCFSICGHAGSINCICEADPQSHSFLISVLYDLMANRFKTINAVVKKKDESRGKTNAFIAIHSESGSMSFERFVYSQTPMR